MSKKEGASRWHLLINTKFTTRGHVDKESVAAVRMKIWLKWNVPEVIQTYSFKHCRVWLTILSNNYHDVNSRLRAAMSDASSITQWLILSHKHLCAYCHVVSHIQEQLPVNICKTISLSFFKSLFCHLYPKEKKFVEGWAAVAGWNHCCDHHCSIVPCALPWPSPPAASGLTHRGCISGKELCLHFAFVCSWQ